MLRFSSFIPLLTINMDTAMESQVMNYVQDNMDNITFKTLRYEEEELPTNEKLRIMTKTLQDDPALFLSKWGRYLSQNTLALFKQIEDNYEVDFYLDSLLYNEEKGSKEARVGPLKQKSAMHTLAQNRRYEYLKRHLRNSDYFSDESIQLRDPALYDQFIGQHIPASEKAEPFANDVTLVNRILSNIDKKYVSDHLQHQKIIDEEQMEEEEEDEDDEESDSEIFERSTPAVLTKKKASDTEMKEVATAEADEENGEDEELDTEELMELREEQRLELIRLLEEKFLAGKDDFDYDQVDYNEEYDDLEQRERDIQDKYFDED